MKTEYAISHLKWKFTQSNSKASEKDKRSLNAIISALNKQNNQQLTDNINLCKLLMYTFQKMCLTNAIKNDYKLINIHLIHNRLRDVFKLDASAHLDSVVSELQGVEIQRLIDNNCLTPKTLLALTSKEDIKKATRKMMSEFIKNN